MATGKQLMKEIYDQFLLCKICFEIYQRPKTLTCLHTFCADCLDKHSDAEYERSYRYMLYNRTVSCPICRKKTEVPAGGIRRLPDNFLVANLADVVSRRKPSEFQECEICKPNIPSKQKQAKSKCLDCSKLLCKKCVDLHMKTKVTQGHSLFDIKVERDIECKVHQDEVVRFYCEPCEQCICVVCTFQEHKGHEISSFSEGMQKYQKSLDSIVTMCRERISVVKEQIDLITNCESVIKNAEEQIRDMAIDSITDIRKNERALVQNLHEVYGEDTLDFLKEKEPLQEKLENLQTTCSLTDIISQDRRIELLLLRKEIQDKVNSLLGNDLNDPPANVMKQVKFVPGRLEFGSLNVDGQDSAGKGEVPGIKISVDTECVESQTDIVVVSNQATLTERLIDNSSSGGIKAEKHKVTQTLIVQVKDSCTSPIYPPSPKIRSRFTMTSPMNVQNCQTMTLPPATNQVRTQTITVPTIDTSSNTNNHEYELVPKETKCTNTPSSPKCERSTLTIKKGQQDQLTDTCDLTQLKDQYTAMAMSIMRDQLCMTESTPTNNKSTLTNKPENAEKYTLTQKIITYEAPTMTDNVVMLDMGVNAKLLGTDKATSTRTIVTVHSCDGDNNVNSFGQNVDTPCEKKKRLHTLSKGTMYEITNFCDTASETDTKSISDKITFTDYFNLINSSTNTNGIESIDCSTETDILGEITALESTKNSKLQNLIEKCLETGVSCDMITELLVRNQIQKKEMCINTEDNIVIKKKVEIKSVAIGDNSVKYTDNSVFYGTSLSHLKTFGVITERNELNNAETKMDSTVYTNDNDSNTGGVKMINAYTLTDPIIDSDVNEKAILRRPSTCEIGTLTDPYQQTMIPIEKQTVHKTDAMSWTDTPSLVNENTSMNSNVYTANFGVSVRPLFTDVKCGPDIVTVNNVATSTGLIVMTCDQASETKVIQFSDNQAGPDFVSMNEVATSTGHSVMSFDKGLGTGVVQYKDSQSETTSPNYNEVGVNSVVETKEIGVLKRPHAMSRSTSTKKLKTSSRSTETHSAVMLNQESNTYTPTTNSSCDPIKFSCVSKCQGTVNIVLKDSSCSPNVCQMTERGTSPGRSSGLVNRGSSPIRNKVSDIAIDVKPVTEDCYTEMPMVMYQDTGVSPFKVKMCNKHVSPIPNLIPKKNTATSTNEVIYENRGLSPIRQNVVQRGVNTSRHSVVSRGLSPIKFKGSDFSVMVSPIVQSQHTETDQVSTQESSTETKRFRYHNKCTEMPQVYYCEKHTSTPQTVTFNKMISTDHISSIDKQTMTFDITANYRGHVHPEPPVTVNRGTCTDYITMKTKDTSTIPTIFTEKASSPVRIVTFNKGVTANKAEIQPKEKFQTAGLQTKPLRPIADSPKSNLESIEELHESDEDCASKECQTETPPRSPRALFGRKAISALDLTQTSPLTHKEKFVLSTPRIGKKSFDGSTFNPFRSGNGKMVCRVETATNTKGFGLVNKGTSTPPVEMEDKAVCTEAIHVTKDDKMAACISKLHAVRQRLEQKPVYVQAPTRKQLSKSLNDSNPSTPTSEEQKTFLSKSVGDDQKVSTPRTHVKSMLTNHQSKVPLTSDKTFETPPYVAKKDGFRANIKNIQKETLSAAAPKHVAIAEKSLESIISPRLLRRTLIIKQQDSSDDSEDSPKLKARKKKPALAQLLERSSSLPEQDSPPFGIPKPKLKTIVPHVIPKLNIDQLTSPRLSRKNEPIPSPLAAAVPKVRHRKSSPVAMGTRIKPILAGMSAFPAGNHPSILPNTPEKQKARQERIDKLRKERQGQSSPLLQNKPPSMPVHKDSPPKKTIKGGKIRSQNLTCIIQDDSSSSSS